jgi:hypothetical protein
VKLRHRLWAYAGHLTQRRIVKDDVRGNAPRAGDLKTHRAQAFEQIAVNILPGVSLDPRPLLHAPLGRPALAREHEIRVARRILHQLDATLGQCHHRIRVVCLPQESVRDQLFDVAADLG